MNSASVTIEPAIRIINGAYLLVDTLKFGLNTSSKPLTSYLTLNDSRLEASYALIIPENSLSTLKVIAGITNSTSTDRQFRYPVRPRHDHQQQRSLHHQQCQSAAH